MLIPQEFTLPTGLKVKYFQTTDATFNIVISLNVGSRDEPTKYSGLCHFLEHAMFRGSAKHPDTRQFHRELGKFSGSANGATGKESHCFSFNGDSEKFLLGLDFLEDFFFTPQFSDLETERQVVIQEIYGEEEPLAGMESQIYESIFKGSRFVNNICGTEESVNNISKKTLQFWRSKFYTPHNCTLYLSSIQSKQEIENKLLASAFNQPWNYVKNPITPEFIKINRRLPKAIKESFTATPNPNKDGQYVGCLSFVIPSPTPECGIALTMLQSILIRIEGVSPLWEATRGEGLVYAINHDIYDFTNFMFSGISWETSEENVITVFEIVKQELEKISKGEIKDWDYHRDRLLFENRVALTETHIYDVIERHIGYDMANYAKLPADLPNLINALTPEAVSAFTTRLLNGIKNWAICGYKSESMIKKLKNKVANKPLIAV